MAPRWAAQALGNIGTTDKRIVPALFSHLEDSSVQSYVVYGLLKIGSKNRTVMLSFLKTVARPDSSKKLQEGAGSVYQHIRPVLKYEEPHLIALLSHKEPRFREAVAARLTAR